MAQSSSQRGRKGSSSASRSRSTSSRAKSTRRKSASGITENISDMPKKLSKSSRNLWKSLSGNPLFIYGGSSLAAGVLARFAYKYYQSHPEIGEFVRDNFSNVENKLREYRSGISESETGARH